jgi:hypothetical protein
MDLGSVGGGMCAGMTFGEGKEAMAADMDIRRPSWEIGKFLRRSELLGACWVMIDEHGMEQVLDSMPMLSWSDLEAHDWVSADPKARRTSILNHPIWRVVQPDLGERPHELRGLEVRGLPRSLSLRLQRLELDCVACGASVKVFRRRQGSDYNHLYFSPACPSATSPGCSRGSECRQEFEAIRAKLANEPPIASQLALFGGVR